jgi:hypothetical protein
MLKKYVCIPRSFLVINVCNQGKTLCSPCTLKRVRATIVVMGKQWVLHNLSVCNCSPRYPACNAHMPLCHLWSASLYKIFPHFLINGTNLIKMLLNTKCVFWFSLQVLYETFFILRRNEWDMIKNVYWASRKVHFILVQF